MFDNIAGINAKLIEHDQKFLDQGTKIDELFSLLDSPDTNRQWIFYRGQFYDAFKLVIDVVCQAGKSIVGIDNYLDDSILEILANVGVGMQMPAIW